MKRFIALLFSFFSGCYAFGQIDTVKSTTGVLYFQLPDAEDSLRLDFCLCDSLLLYAPKRIAAGCDTGVGGSYTGYFNYYRKDKRLFACGYFKKGVLHYGLFYTYDKYHNLFRVSKYFSEKDIGDCVPVKPASPPQPQYDSLFITRVKKYCSKEFGYQLKGDFYTNWKENNNPYYSLFVSAADTVQCPPDYANTKYGSPFIDYESEGAADWAGSFWRDRGYHAFVYKTYANSSTQLTPQFLDYSNEAKCFIIFHELLHNYVSQLKIKIPYEFHEALGDVVGNYCTLNFCTLFLSMDLRLVHRQIELNEKIYECLNKYIPKITKSEKNISGLNASCQKEVTELLGSGNNFQTDRFANSGNNGFLLKNMNYCKNYFLLKRVLLKQGSVFKLLEIMKSMPKTPEACVLYLESFAEKTQ